MDIKNIKFLKRISQAAIVFCIVICALTIINYAQTRNQSPIDSPALEQLLHQFDSDQDNVTLQNDIRRLDLLVRKAYFTNQWQVRFGGYLLLFGVIVLLISQRLIQKIKAKTSVAKELGDVENSWEINRKTQKWYILSGGGILCISLFLGFVTHQQLPGNIEKTEISENTQNNENASADDNTLVATNQLNTEALVDTTTVNETETVSVEENTEEINEVENNTEKEVPKPIEEGIAKDYSPTPAEMYSNWPNFRGPAAIGVSYHKNIPNSWDGAKGTNIAWKTKVPLKGYNSPIIWGNYLFCAGAGTAKREVYCYNRFSGALLWSKDVGPYTGSPASAPKTTDDTGLSASTMATDGKRVFAIFGTGDLICLDFEGKELWGKNIGVPDNHYGHSSSLLVHNATLIVQKDDNKGGQLMGLWAHDGSEKWKIQRSVQVSWSSPILINTGSRFELILSADPLVASYNPETGEELWKNNCMTGEVGPSCAYASGITFASNEYAKLAAISNQTGQILWENNDYLPEVSSPVANDKYLFIATSYGDLVCYDIKTGEAYWEEAFDEGFYSSPILAEDKIYIMDLDGNVHVVKAQSEFELIGTSSLGERASSTPATANGYLYIRGNDHLFAIKQAQ